jgi:hypothetical protein
MIRGHEPSVRVVIARQVLAGFFVAMLLGAVLVHIFSELPSAYSWGRTLALFRDALIDSYFVVFAVIATFAGISSRGKGALRSWLEKTFKQPSRLSLSVAVAGLLASEMLYFSHSYTLADQFLLPLLLICLVSMLEDRRFMAVGLSVAVGIGGLITVSYIFTIIKSQLFILGKPHDSWIVSLEALVFGQPIYQSVATWAGKNSWAVVLSDWVYFLFFHHIALVALFLFARADRLEEIRYFLSLSICYLIGVLSYFLLPTLGPVFFDQERFSYIKEFVSFTPMIQRLLQHSTDAVVRGELEVINTYAFIAGMPSLHMAHETVMLFFSRKSPVMFLLSLTFWVLSFIAVLVLGWHYLFEAVSGMLLAVVVLPIALLTAGPTFDRRRLSLER